MTLNRKVLKRVSSPVKLPRLANSSLRKKTFLRRLSHEVQFGATSKANLKVVVRVRPENQRESDNNSRSVIDIVDNHMLIFDPSRDEEDFFFHGSKQKFRDLNKKHPKEQKFMFERVFGPDSSNEDIFETTTKDIIETVLNGYNCSVFAYGATGSGKTHTMIGNEENPGIAFLTVMELYKRIEDLVETKHFEVGVSYLEIYNEMVRDLLVPGKPLNLHESGQHIQVTGLSLHKPKDAVELLRILEAGNSNRSQHPTDSNAESSRSHAVFQVFVKQHDKTSGVTSRVSIAKLSMIDLAGSERGAATGFTGARFREGANINKSLLALGNCINALADGKRHIPYRDSKLTRLLKDSLGGNCQSVMIAAVTKSSLSFEDTFNTLRYATRAKTIKTMLKKNVVDVDHHVSQYLKIVEELQNEITTLKAKIAEYEAKGKVTLSSSYNSLTEDEREMYEETIQKLKKQLEENEPGESEKAVMSQFHELNCQLKGYQRELLQMETSERELELKIYTNRLQLVRMNILSFACSKLEKGISKTERTIETIMGNLLHIQKRKEYLQNRLTQTRSEILEFYENFKQGASNMKSVQISAESKMKQIELEQTVRDSYQVNEYLKELVNKFVDEQNNSEKLVLSLLGAVKYFYLRLKSVNLTDTEIDEMFQDLLALVNVNRLEWADLKHTEDSFGEEILSKFMAVDHLSIDKNRLVNLPVLSSFTPSPLNASPQKLYRRSIMKQTTRSLRKVPEQRLLSPILDTSPKHVVDSQEPKMLAFSHNSSITDSKKNSTAEDDKPTVFLEVSSLVSDATSKYAIEQVQNCRKSSLTDEENFPSAASVVRTAAECNNSDLHQDGRQSPRKFADLLLTTRNHEISGISQLENTQSSLDSTYAVSPKKKPVAKVSPTYDSSTLPATIECEPSVEATMPYSGTLPGGRSVETSANHPCRDLQNSQLENHGKIGQKPQSFVMVSNDCNSTFSVENGNSNETFCVSNEQSYGGELSEELLEQQQDFEEVQKIERNQEASFSNLAPPPAKVGVQSSKGATFRSSKTSFSRWPPSSLRSNEKSLKRSSSVPALPGKWSKPLPHSASKILSNKKSPRRALQKSSSFLKKLPGPLYKHNSQSCENMSRSASKKLEYSASKDGVHTHQITQKPKRVLGLFNSKSNLEKRLASQEKLVPSSLVSCNSNYTSVSGNSAVITTESCSPLLTAPIPEQ